MVPSQPEVSCELICSIHADLTMGPMYFFNFFLKLSSSLLEKKSALLSLRVKGVVFTLAQILVMVSDVNGFEPFLAQTLHSLRVCSQVCACARACACVRLFNQCVQACVAHVQTGMRVFPKVQA